MCLHGDLCSIPFNSICNMTTFGKKNVDSTPGVECVCVREEYCACMVLYAPFPLV